MNGQNESRNERVNGTSVHLPHRVNNSHEAKTYLCRKNLWRGKGHYTEEHVISNVHLHYMCASVAFTDQHHSDSGATQASPELSQ